MCSTTEHGVESAHLARGITQKHTSSVNPWGTPEHTGVWTHLSSTSYPHQMGPFGCRQLAVREPKIALLTVTMVPSPTQPATKTDWLV